MEELEEVIAITVNCSDFVNCKSSLIFYSLDMLSICYPVASCFVHILSHSSPTVFQCSTNKVSLLRVVIGGPRDATSFDLLP